jgi:hypothetical protein
MVDVQTGGGVGEAMEGVNESHADRSRAEEPAQPNASASAIPQDEMPPSKVPSKASSTRNSTPVAASADLRESAHTANDTATPPEQALQTQPTTKAVSTSSSATAKAMQDAPAAPYGTRSRNRGSRINYAEDVEMDFEMAPASTNGNASDPTSRASAAAEGAQSTGVGGKKGSNAAGPGNAPWGTSGPNSKDHPPNPEIQVAAIAVTSPAVAPAPPAKRRKNAASHAANGGHASSAAPSHAGARRANNAAAAPNSSRETNMMTFENTGARLKNNRLQADDGQTVSINGK